MIGRRSLIPTSLLAVVAAAALAACGSTSSASNPPPSSASNASSGASSSSSAPDAPTSKTARITLSIPDPIDSSVGVTAKHFADQVKEDSSGSVEIRVIPNGTSFGGDQQAAVTRVRDGSLEATILSTSVYASFIKQMNAISLPYLFGSTDDLVKYLDGGPGKHLAEMVADQEKTKVLAFLTRTPREVTNSKRPITQPSDLAGLKLRVPANPLWTDFFGALHASPTPMDFSEVFTALQTGTIDGQENPIEVPVANKFYQVQKYLSMTNHITDAFVLGISAEKWNSLTPEQQQYLQEAADDTATFKTSYDADQVKADIKILEDHGTKVNELSKEGLAEFKSKAQALYPDFQKLIGADFMKETTDFVSSAGS